MADLVQDRAHRPGVDQPVVGQLDQRERVELAARGGAAGCRAAERRRREAGAHVGERRRRRDRLRADAQVHEHVLVAVERDPVAGEQPLAERALPLPEQLEVEVPDPLGRAHLTMSLLF